MTDGPHPARNPKDRIEEALGARVLDAQPLSGGCIAEVRRLTLEDGRQAVAKQSPGGGLAVEGYMLGYLSGHSALPLPEVFLAEDDLLLLEYLPHDGRMGREGERDAARHLAALHAVTAPAFGLERDTLIGPLPQANPRHESWIAFFREARLLPMIRLADARGALNLRDREALERLCGRLEDFLEEPEAPALLHGDAWSGNLLFDAGRVAGFIDPAIYYGDPEIELAFGTLFGPFGEAFFEQYQELRPLRPGFFEQRRELYLTYPLLVHAALFSGGYGAQAGRIARRLL